MATYTPEQLFTVARDAYDECTRLIEEMVGIFNKASSANHINASDLMVSFDAVLQACLLTGAFADGQIETNELIFIKNLAKNVDILIPINNEIYAQNPSWSYVEWERLPLLDEATQRKMVSMSIGVIKKHTDVVVEILATIDDYSPKDFLKEITKQVSTIAIALAGVDKDDLSSSEAGAESSLMFASYKVLVVDLWKQKTENKIRFRH